MFVTAIIAAGGRGHRLGGPVPKQLRRIGGRTVLERSIEPFDASERVDEIVVVLPPDLAGSPPTSLGRVRTSLRVVPGGARRQDSVVAGLAAAASASEVVVIHDAARPFCTVALVERTIDAAAESGAAIAALAALDTVKEGSMTDGVTIVRSTLPREEIFLAQTPQAFRIDLLRHAIARNGDEREATDEASLIERAGYPVRLVPGEAHNIKVTSEADLKTARRMVSHDGSQVGGTRVGLGYDIHRFVEGRRLVLGGVEIPGPRGLLGHSDADAVCHAVTDAILGAAAAGDIGAHFPDTDPRFKDASSIELLRHAVDLVRARGYAIGNVDVVVVTEWPKIQSVAEEMRQRLADVLGVTMDCVSVKGKTGEHVGEVGQGVAIVVHAVASLMPHPPTDSD